MKSWSKTTRICVMMALDTVFLAVELGVGYYVSSLALIADAFHMLNDIISLAVGLWAVTLARKESNDRYSYGWLRAEILGAFFNATFLIGLCVTIVLEAIQRFFDPPDIRNPEVVLVVGCFGLVSNLVGFWVLGGHGHSHGPGEGDVEAGHGHDHAHAHSDPHDEDAIESSPDGREGDNSCPDDGVDDDESFTIAPPAITTTTDEDGSRNGRPAVPETHRHIAFAGLNSPDRGERSASRGSARSRGLGMRGRANSARRVPTSIDDISIHPASFRNDIREIIEASQARNVDEEEEEGDSDDATTVWENGTPSGETSRVSEASERTPLLANKLTQSPASTDNDGPIDKHDQQHSRNGVAAHDHGKSGHRHSRSHSHNSKHSHTHHHSAQRARRDSHGGHHHNEPRDPSKAHGHSHGDMGMNAMVLHVIGDALGNIGVIVTALIIWKTSWTYRMYADPIVSLFITLIILKSAIPLTKATSKILLQATPDHINLNDIREDIQDLDGVLSCHHIHVWQLSDTQIVASLHIEVSFPISEYGGEKYMKLARRVRKCLHGYGIHSATIQPEFRLNASGGAGSNGFFNTSNNGVGGSRFGAVGAVANAGAAAASPRTSTTPATVTSTTAVGAGMDAGASGPSCLLDCVDDCVAGGCCSMGSRAASGAGSPPGSSGHSVHEGHSHSH